MVYNYFEKILNSTVPNYTAAFPLFFDAIWPHASPLKINNGNDGKFQMCLS